MSNCYKTCTFWFIFKHGGTSLSYLNVFRAEFEFTSQYVVQVDDFFLHYLQKVSCCSLMLYAVYWISYVQ